MMTCITGTPGTGKSTVATELERRGHRVVRAGETVGAYLLGDDPERETHVVDAEAWAAAFTPVDGIVEGHLAHLLGCDRVVVLRCRPDLLTERLARRGYGQEKIRENAEAEALDVILIETLERHTDEAVLEVDVTDMSVSGIADQIEGFVAGRVPPASGLVDWSFWLLEGA
ncbi:adenylate kinase family protein [Methanofollis fontis]|uniref:Putative adenylate kinase n=1 Tax=Methanofollis fontis TaxID=2052832 RepID=A0A483CTE6_9EURY|nr:adenylate kinase family protein [Methanofollis fontis]TAJ44518.1 adenylate kinase [Methanofollis fontis]